MANYSTPGVYINNVKAGQQSISQPSSSVGAMLGVTRSGLVGEVQLVTSFTEFTNLYANGLDTAFMNESDLTYAVHGFFANGGQKVYIGRVVSPTAKKAKSSEANATITAKYEGAWGNNIKITFAQNEDYVAESNLVYDVTVSVGTSDSVTIKGVTKDTFKEALTNNSKVSNWITVEEVKGEFVIPEEAITFTTGADGISDLTDSIYLDALNWLDNYADEVTTVAIPGETSDAINDGLISYCDKNKLIPILDMPMGSTVKQTKDCRKKLSANGGVLVYPWGKVTDPLTGGLKTVPSCGHYMGVHARIVEERGIHKVPAGSDAVVRGFVDLEKKLTNAEIGELNTVGVVSIISKTNSGILVWGARGLNNDQTMKYVSDVTINYTISKALLTGTEFAVFEPNTPELWSKLSATCNAYLETLRVAGTLKGTKEEAYYVTIDETNNTNESINNGELNIEIGYAPVKPAEFIIIKLAHTIDA